MVSAGRVRTAGLEVAYDQAGSGPPLVLVHGTAGDAREWRLQIAGLSDDFTVIAWDEPGAGARGNARRTGARLRTVLGRHRDA
jgi:pimeloyl-ACP methyl ester carboxylesterase